MKRRIIAMALAVVMLVGMLPVQAFAVEGEPQETNSCAVEGCTYGAGHEGACSNAVAPEEPKAEPAADAAVYVTVSNLGELGMAYEEVTVSDINADGKLSVDEALYAAHTVYGKGYTSQAGTVTQLWGVETTNVSFFVNHSVISTDVSAETIRSGDYLVASVDQDAVNDYDKYSRFDVMEKSVSAGSEFTLTLTDDAGNALAGMEIGLSNGNGTTTMTGLTTDVNGSVILTLDQEGMYCITAKGTVVESSIDVNTMEITSIETPIIAPVCVVIVSGIAEVEVDSTEGNGSNDVVPENNSTTWNTGSSHSVTVGFTVVDCLNHNVERMHKELTVTPGLAKQYFPDCEYGGSIGMTTEVGENNVTPIDVLVAAHLDAYGDAFAANPGEYIEGFDYAIKMFGVQSEITWTANGIMPYAASDYGNLGYAINQYVVQSGDEICFYRMSFYSIPANIYASFDQTEAEVEAGKELTLRLGYCATMDYFDTTFAAANVEIYNLNEDGTLGSSTGLTTDANGEVRITFEEAGTYYLTCQGEVDYADMMGNPTSALSPAYVKITVKNAPVAVERVTLNKSEATLEIGETVTLTATVSPEDATDKTVTWSSDNTAVATVVDGVVTAVNAGTATITATAGEKTATCIVTVNAPAPEMYEIQTGVATVNQNWMEATAIYLDANVVSHTRIEGTNEFTVVLKEQKETIGLELDLLTYKKNQVPVWSPTVNVNGTALGTVTASETGVEGSNGLSGAWPAIWSGADVTPTWSSGKADITIALTMGSNINTYVLHLVIEGNEGPTEVAVESVALDKSKATLEIGETVTLTATVSPEDATDKTVTWSSGNDAVATVIDGVVTAVSEGTATITATAGEKTATCIVTVNAPAPEMYEIQTGVATVNQNWMEATAIYLDANVVSHTRIEGTNEFTVVLKEQKETIGLELDLLTYKKNQVPVWSPTVSVNGAVLGTVTASETGVEGSNGLSGAWPAIWSGAAVTPAWSSGKADITIALTMGSNINTYVLHLEVEGQQTPEEPELYEIQTGISTVNQNWMEATAIYLDANVVSHTRIEGTNEFTVVLKEQKETIGLELDLLTYKKNQVPVWSPTVNVNGTALGTVTASETGVEGSNGLSGAWPAIWSGADVTPAWSSGKADITIALAMGSNINTYVLHLEVEGQQTPEEPELYEIQTGIATVNQNWMEATAIYLDANVVSHTRIEGTNEFTVVLKEQKETIGLELDLLTYKKNQVPVWSPAVSVNGAVLGTVTASETGVEGSNGLSGAWPAIWSGADVTPAWSNGKADITIALAMGSNINTYVLHLVIDGNEGPTEVAVESVALDKNEATLEIGETVTLTATVSPEDATDKTVNWESSNTVVAVVDNGVVTAREAGTAIITAKAGEKTATCTVTVAEAAAAAEYVLDLSSQALPAGRSGYISSITFSGAEVSSDPKVTVTNVTASPPVNTVVIDVVLAEDTAANAKVDLSILQAGQGTNMATMLNYSGDITNQMVSAGATVTSSVQLANGTGKTEFTTVYRNMQSVSTTWTINFTVEGADSGTVAVEKVELNKAETTIEVGATETLTATVTPDNATEKAVTWSSDNTAVATVVDGVVTAVNAGTATITAAAGEKTATCIVTVNAPAPEMYEIQTGVVGVKQNYLDMTSLYIGADVVSHTRKEGTNEFTVVLAEDTDTTAAIPLEMDLLACLKNQYFLSPSVAVNGTVCGEITGAESGVEDKTGQSGAWPGWWTGGSVTPAWENGKADVVLSLKRGNNPEITYTLHLVIEGNEGPSEVAVESVALDKSEATLEIGETVTLTATVSPEDATDKTVTWTSDNNAVAQVVDGTVTAIGTGTATITATAGDKSATCTVTVSAQEAGVYQIDTGVTAVTQNYLNATAIRLGADVLYCNPSSNNANEYFVVLAADTDKTAAISLEMDLLAYSQSQYSSSPSVSVNSYKSGTITAADTGVEGAWPGTWTGATVTPTWDENGEATLVFSLKIGRNAATMYKLNLVIGRGVSEVTLNRTETAMRLGETLTLVPTVKPTYTADTTVDWNTSDPAVVTVADGVVTAAGLGAATITAEIGGKTASCTVTVVADTSFVIQTNDKAVLGSGDQFQEAYITEIDVGGTDVAFSKMLQTATTEMQIYIILDENTPDDADVLLDFTLGAVVSPDSAKVTGADPTAVKLENGKATYEVQALNYANSPSHKYTIVLRNSNAVPSLKEGVPAETSVELLMQEQYNVNLAEIFGDADGDDLNYTVTIGEETTKIDAEYTYEAWETGEHTLVFKANDGFEDSAVYTVKIKVTESGERYETTVKVPDAITPSFYITQGYEADGIDKLGSELTAVKGESKDGWTTYTVSVPGSISRISVRGTADTIDWGGMAFAVEENAVITLRQVNAIISSKIVVDDVEVCPNEEQALFKVEYADEVGNRFAVPGSRLNDQYGFLGYRFLLVAADNSLIYTYYAEPLGDVANDYSTNVGVTKTITTDSAETVTTTLPLGAKSAFSITAPVEATVQMFSQTPGNYYGNVKIPAFESKENGDGTKTVTFNVTSGTATTYRVSMEGKITKAGYLSGDSVTVTWDENDPGPNYRRNYEFDENGYYKRADDSILVNVNHRNNLHLNVGQTHTLRSYRIWQIINNDTQNIMIEPDFHVNIISGKDVISLTEKADYQGNGTGKWMDITALKAGTAVLEVTYDAIEILEREAADYEINGMGGLTFNACDPVRTALVVVQVGAAEANVNFGIVNNGGNVWDAEHDTLYFLGNQGQLTFSPSSASGISSVAVSSDNGVNWSYLEASSGNYTANIAPGNNIIRVTTSAGAVSYQVVRGDKLSYTVSERMTDAEGNALTADGDGLIEAGETVEISFTGQHNPYGKMSGIYNPWTFFTKYTFNGTQTSGAAGMYIYAHYSKVYLTIPEDAKLGDEYTLTGGYTVLNTGWGGSGGGHRTVGNVVPPNLDAPNNTASAFNIFPDITIKVGDSTAVEETVEAESVSLDQTVATVEAGKTLTLTATVTPDNATDKTVTWSSSNTAVAGVSADGIVTARAKGTATITVTTTNGKTATCEVTVTAAEPEVPELDIELDGEIGHVIVSFVDNGVRLASDLNGMEEQYKTPLGTIVAETKVPFKAYDTVAAVTLRLLDALNMTASYSGNENSGFYLSSIGNFTVGETTYASFGEFDAGAGSGWMITQNDVFINKGASEFIVKDGDVIEWQYTCQLGADIGDTYSKADVEAVEKLINDIGDVTLDSEAAIEAAREAYDKLAPVQQAAVSNYQTLTTAEAELAALKASEEDKNAANNVINLIEEIGELKQDRKDAIQTAVEAAREAYDALTDAQKALVTNYGDLEKAEDYLELLNRVPANIADIYTATGNYLAGKTLGTGSTNGEWAALGLARSGRSVSASYYEAAVAYVKENISEGRLHAVKSTENSRLILALTAIGKDVTDVDGHNLLSGLNDLTYIGKQGVNGLIYALIALDSHAYTPVGVTKDALVEAILAKQLDDGGWSLGNSSEVDLTASAIQALAPYYSSNTSVKTAVDKALTWLSNAQNQDGSFSTTDGANAESIAQVIVALTALGIDPDTDSRFIKTGITTVQALAEFYVEGGGFEHIANTGRDDMATEQGYYALVAYTRFKNRQTTLYDMSDVTIETDAQNQAAADAVEALIRAIGTPVTLDSENRIEAARAGYDALTDTQKALVDNLSVLTDAETALAELKQTAEDAAAANAVKQLIDSIGTVDLTKEDEITAARNAYSRLTNLQKNLVGAAYLKKLTDAETELTAQKKAAADEAAASAVEQKISAIGTSITLGSESKISTARNAYNALTADQKVLVSNYQTLVNAEAALKVLKSTVSVTFSVLGCYKHGTGETSVHTLADGNLHTWLAAKTYKIAPGDTVKDLLEQALTAAGMTWSNPTGNYVESVTRNGVTIGEFTNGSKSGWMYTLNGAHPNLGVAQQTLVDGDKVVLHYTDDYTKEEGGKQNNSSTSTNTSNGTTNYITTVNNETAESVERLITDIGEEITLESEAKILAARAAYDMLTAEQRILVENYDKLLEAEAALAELKGDANEDAYITTGDYIQGLGTPGVGNVGGEWMVIGLARSGRDVPDAYYDHVVDYVNENINGKEQLHSAKSTDNSRLILALTSIGKDVSNVDGHDLLKGLNDMDYIQNQGINGPIWALLAFDSGNYPVPDGSVTREKLIEVILDAQLSDGGWAMSGEVADPDVTGMAVQALAPYRKSDAAVKKAVEEAIWTLSEIQNDNGSFNSVDGPNSESIAQVIVALAALGIDADTDARFVKNGISALDALLTYYISGGGFRHVLDGNLDGMATEQAYYALAAYNRMLEDKTSLYDMTDVIDRGGDVIIEETTEPTEAPTEPVVEEDEGGSAIGMWISIMVICAGAIGAVIFNRKKLFGRFM